MENSMESSFCSVCSVSQFYSFSAKSIPQQESLPVGCVPTACKTVCFSVATTRCHSQGMGPQVNKFEQVSSVGHQMSVAGGCTVKSKASWAMIVLVDGELATVTVPASGGFVWSKCWWCYCLTLQFRPDAPTVTAPAVYRQQVESLVP